MQAEINVGLLGHVDHGKTTLTKALSGKWTDTHSEEIKRGISIRLGYADTSVYFCSKCNKFGTSETCSCGGKAELKRKVSFVDAPGHETLMTAVIAASSILDGALFLIAANETCPQPQTTEHLTVLNSTGIKNIIVVQTKIDLVPKEKALENYKQIRQFLKGTVAENAPIIPVSAHHTINIDKLLGAMETYVPTPNRSKNAKLRMYISRSFDINKPGTKIEKLKGGVLGGSIISGELRTGDMIEIRPGVVKKEGANPISITCEAKVIMEESEVIETALPGGLLAVGTTLDPALTKSDSFVGSMIGHPGELPSAVFELQIKHELLKRNDLPVAPLKPGDPIVVNVHTATGVGVVAAIGKKGTITIKLKKPIVVDSGMRVALSRRVGQRWRLSGWGTVN